MKSAVFSPTVQRLTLALSLIASVAAQGEIYKYVDPATGAVEYTNQPRKGAVKTNMGDTLSEIPTGNRPSRNSSGGAVSLNGRTVNASTNASAGTAIASVDAGTQKTRDGTRRHVLSEELSSEEKLLADARSGYSNGKPLPFSDEGVGSPKYIDRVKQLEKTVRLHERNVASLKQELANLKL
jgi:Domain of unknown function (DUF4124)